MLAVGRATIDAWDGLMVRKDTKIRTAKHLEGKTIAVNNLNNVGTLAINTAMAKEGGDYTKVKYTEVPFPEMNAALEAPKRVDAIWQVEPGYTGALAAGSTVAVPSLRADGAEPHGRRVLREQGVHREEQGRARALPPKRSRSRWRTRRSTPRPCARRSATYT